MVELTRRSISAAGLALFLSANGVPARAQVEAPNGAGTRGAKDGQWPTHGGDLYSWRYSPLDKINAENFKDLELAWRFKTANLGPAVDPIMQATPLMVNGVLYTTAGTRRAAIAIDAGTGELLWTYSLNEGERGRQAPRQGSGRGLCYWTDGKAERVLYVTPGYRLISLDAKTGRPAEGFGEAGQVDLKLELDQQIDLEKGKIGLNATPLVVGDVIVVGAAFEAGDAPNKTNIKGAVRAYDIRTGKRLWIFHTIPKKGEFGAETWLNDSNSWTGNTGVWAQMSADPELGLVYVGVESATADWYGGNRPGANLFGESIVALDLKTGKRRWHYQMVHHGIWDRDVPCAAVLADITVGGRKIKAIAQPTKQSWLYVLDRVTGKPVWPIPERPVPKGDVPGEWYSPTQPIPSKPPAYDRQGVMKDDLIDFTPELRAEAEKVAADYKLGPIFTPPVYSKWPRPLGTLMLPNTQGGSSWPGASFDPETNIIYLYSMTRLTALGIGPIAPEQSDAGMGLNMARDPNATSRRRAPLGVRGLPLIKPPYGRVTAIDLNKGDIVWQVAHGETPDSIRNHEALKGVKIPRTGSAGLIGTLTTKTLVVIGDAETTTGEDGVKSGWLRAYDKKTGAEVGQVRMPTRQTGTPITYLHNDQQYIVLGVGGPDSPGELIAYRLP
ncbi:PQQ-binding-like beta-propeller repeat protein [Phenylobacterium sp.]|uniref:outer membrane protein assembly factor BamB family protein n=1 Tax=Phenylobacterium sp. TaxID=1871053 RepID=UPI002BD7DCC0|nr:PQQ-binding-like beta-propeller repeat protein [Phenylobacterium sp.]HVI31447.1 PQQ-binding-like beta-propeller repeat protein [Phenylobacterium sp.]